MVTDPFGPGAPIADLNTSAQELDLTASPDERHIFFLSDRDGTSKLYQADR
jgi:hypothetical protein